ncbi:MAG: hypothetical protein IKB21_02420 [Clostridia bacterium]|nr:hypothetical protein [Clostridia bacterium]MBR2433445.1 hypothetical protein [Clostridia bacterium]
MRKSIKQFRTKRRLLGANPYQKTGSESLLSATFSLNEIAILRLVFCNDRLYNDPIMWKTISEMVEETDFEVSLGAMNQDTYKVMMALDRFQNQGRTVFVNVVSRRQAINVVEGMVDEYFSVLGTEDGEQVVSEMNMPLDVLQAIQGEGFYNPPEMAEDECMYQ